MSNLHRINYYQLCEAIFKREKVRIQNLITDNTPVNIPNAQGNTPLHWTIIKFDDFEIISMLLDKGADIHARNHHYYTPLNLAIQNGKMVAISLLIDRGGFDEEDFDSSLLIAIKRNDCVIVKKLIDYGQKHNPSINLVIPLKAAISQNKLEMIKLLLLHCPLLNSSDQYIPKDLVMKSGSQSKDCIELLLTCNFTVDLNNCNDDDFIYAAVENGHLPIVVQLLKRGINVNMVSLKTGLNLLTIACLNKHHEIVEKLLEHHADVNVSISAENERLNNQMNFFVNMTVYRQLLPFYNQKNDSIDVSCLHIAVFNSDPKMTKLLLKYGAKTQNDPKFSIITRIAVYNNCEEVVCIFLEHGVNVNDTDLQGNSLLHFCIHFDPYRKDNCCNVVKLLLEKSVNIQSPGINIVFEAMTYDHRIIAQLLLDYNADVQYIDPDGNTLLHIAVEKKFNRKFIETLLKLNCSVNIVNNDGFTPLIIACQRHFSHYIFNIFDILLFFGADVNCSDRNLMTPLHFACQDQNLKLIEIFLNKGANVHAIDLANQTPLHIACRSKSQTTTSIIQLLLKHGADIEAVDNHGWTPFLIACNSSTNEVVRCFLDNHTNSHATIDNGEIPIYIEYKIQRNSTADILLQCLLEHINIQKTDNRSWIPFTPHATNNNSQELVHIICQPENNMSVCMTLLKLVQSFPYTHINLNSIDIERNTLLHRAVDEAPVQVIKSLIKYGANINILNKNNLTPLQRTFKYLGENRYRHYPTDYRIKAKILIQHVVKLKVAGLNVNDQNWNIVTANFEKIVTGNKVKLMKKCEKEIEMMKKEIINTGNIGMTHNITFYNLLKNNIHYLSKFFNNEKIQQTLDLNDYNDKFPLYIDIVRNRFREAKIRYRLMNPAREYFRLNINQRLPGECIDMVLSYFNSEELKIFIEAMKPSNNRQSFLLTRIESDTKEILMFQY